MRSLYGALPHQGPLHGALLKIYNDAKFSPTVMNGMLINALPKEAQPAACIGCGACEHACPVTAERPEERERRNSCDLCEEKCEFGRRREMPPRALVVRAVNPQQKAVKKFEDKAVDPVGDADFPF